MLNLTQLTEAEDSLVRSLNERRAGIPDLLMRTFYFFTGIDSTRAARFEPDSNYNINFLATYSKVQQEEIIEDAIQKFRRSRDNIRYYKQEIESREEMIYKHQAEWHRKFTLSVACFVLFFIGAPMGAIIRRGGLGLPVVVSVLFFVLFHIISITGEKSVKSGAIDANIGMWIAPVVLLPLGIFLTFKATTDSPLLDAESWKKTFSKLFSKKKK